MSRLLAQIGAELGKVGSGDQAMNKEQEEKRNAKTLLLQGERQLKDVKLNFGMQFAQHRCQRIETLTQELHYSLAQDNQRGIKQSSAALQEELYELKSEVRCYYGEDEEDGLFRSIPCHFTDDKDDNTGGSSPILSPRRPGPRPGSDNSAELPLSEHESSALTFDFFRL